MAVDRTNAERQRRYIARLKAKAGGINAEAEGDAHKLDAILTNVSAKLTDAKATLERQEARIEKLEKELAGERTRVKMLTEGLQNARRQKRAEPKPVKPPLPPDEERDRIIKSLRTRVRNLTWELSAIRELNAKLALKNGMMNFQTMSAIAKALHPDQQPSEAQRAEACKLFTAWKADKSAADRKAR